VKRAGDYDVIVMGGGLAGACLAIQLRRGAPELRLLVLERDESPYPEGAHKVGESSVEVASHYFRTVLGVEDLIEKEVPKFGLRFFMSDGDNRDITKRLEFGPKNFLTMPSDQIDRGQFENGLTQRARELGIDFVSEARVTAIEISPPSASPRLHHVEYARGKTTKTATAPWVVDASGRSGLLKKELGIARPSRHNVNAAWFRIDHPIDIDDWTQDPGWLGRADAPRRLSTNHLMGPGYWVWFIPLAHDRTSVGIVAENGLHPFSELQTFERSLAWLDTHEPQAAAVVRAHEERGERMDFLALKNYSRDAKQVFSGEGWALTGDAGIFLDPLYSPGSDFIAMSNSFIADLILREVRGEEIEPIAQIYDKAYRSLAQTYLVNYYRQYSLMADSRVMISKIVWDFTMYWGGVAILFCGDRLCDPSFMARVNPLLQSFAFTNLGMQAYFREWMKAGKKSPSPQPIFIDYAGIDFLAELNANLGEEFDDDALIEQMGRNLSLAKNLRLEIIAEASRTSTALEKDDQRPITGHLDKAYALMRETEASPDGASSAA
jgi:flavin-dependent dehydrogenase